MKVTNEILSEVYNEIIVKTNANNEFLIIMDGWQYGNKYLTVKMVKNCLGGLDSIVVLNEFEYYRTTILDMLDDDFAPDYLLNNFINKEIIDLFSLTQKYLFNCMVVFQRDSAISWDALLVGLLFEMEEKETDADRLIDFHQAINRYILEE